MIVQQWTSSAGSVNVKIQSDGDLLVEGCGVQYKLENPNTVAETPSAYCPHRANELYRHYCDFHVAEPR